MHTPAATPASAPPLSAAPVHGATPGDNADAGFAHDAFISYSRRDKVFAQRLEAALEAQSLPGMPGSNLGGWRGLLRPAGRRLDVFRDEDDFTGTDYHSAVSQHLGAARKLIVVCSPAARASAYVGEEIRLFAQARGAQHIIPVLLDGVPNNEVPNNEVPNNEVAANAAAGSNAAQPAFPDALMACLQMPLAVPYRGFDVQRGRPDRAPFEGAWFTLLANLLGVSRSAVEQREKRRLARARQAWIGGLAVLSVSLAGLSVWALQERDRATDERNDALRSQSVFLAQTSQQQLALKQPTLALKLALQALPRQLDKPDRPWVAVAETALVAAYAGQDHWLDIGGPRTGLDDKPQGAAISPDGQRAVLSYGAQAELWNLLSGELLRTLRADNDHSSVAQMAFSPDGTHLLLSHVTHGTLVMGGEGNSTVRGSLFDIVDPATGDLRSRFQVAGHRVNQALHAPDGKHLFLATDERLLLIDTSSGQPRFEARWADLGPTLAPPYAQLRFSADGSRLALLTAKGVLGVLQVPGGEMHRLAGADSGQAAVAANSLLAFADRAGEALAVATGNTLTVHRVATRVQANWPLALARSLLALAQPGSGDGLLGITSSGQLLRWQNGRETVAADTATFIGTPGAAATPLRSAIFDSRGQAALLALADGSVLHHDLAKGVRRQVQGPGSARLVGAGMAAQAGGAQRVWLASDDSRVRIWQTNLVPDWQQRRTVAGATAAVAAVATFAPLAGPLPGRVATGSPDGVVALIDQALIDPALGPAAHQGSVTCLAFDGRGQRLLSGGQDMLALLWTLPVGQPSSQSPQPPQPPQPPPLRMIGHQGPVDFCALSPDGSLVLTGSSGNKDGGFRLWDSATGALRHVLRLPDVHRDPIHNASIRPQAVFTPDGKTVVTVTAGDGMVISQPALVWDVASGKLRHTLAHPQGAIWSLRLMPGGQQVLTASYDRSAALWEVATGSQVRSFSGQASTVLHALPVDQGRLLVTATAEGVVRVLRTTTGQQVHAWRSANNLFNAEVSPDGRWLALASNVAASNGKHGDKRDGEPDGEPDGERDGEPDTSDSTTKAGAVIELWDAVAGMRVASLALPGHPLAPLGGLAFAPDGRTLMAVGRDHSLRLLGLPPTGQRLIDLAWQRLGATPGTLARDLLTPDQRVRFALQPP